MNQQDFNKRCAEVLVECGYASEYKLSITYTEGKQQTYLLKVKEHWVTCNPFADTLEGRRQADAIEDYLYEHHRGLWQQSNEIIINGIDEWECMHQWRLDRINWCLEQL